MGWKVRCALQFWKSLNKVNLKCNTEEKETEPLMGHSYQIVSDI